MLSMLFHVTCVMLMCATQEEAATYRHLGAILRHCLMSTSEGEERTEEMHRCDRGHTQTDTHTHRTRVAVIQLHVDT